MGWCHGFKLHFVCNDLGEIITFVLTGANVDDRDMRVWDVLAKQENRGCSLSNCLTLFRFFLDNWLSCW